MSELTIAVITRIPDARKGEGGNMALTIPYLDDGSGPDYMPRVKDAAKLLGPFVLEMRAPVFTLGEILILGVNGRDALGRKPDKWDVDMEEFDTLEAAWERSIDVLTPKET